MRAKKIKYNGSEYSITELSELSGIEYRTLAYRIEKGIPIEFALQKKYPIRKSVIDFMRFYYEWEFDNKTSREVYQEYLIFCKNTGAKSLKIQEFMKQLFMLCPNLDTSIRRRKINGEWVAVSVVRYGHKRRKHE